MSNFVDEFACDARPGVETLGMVLARMGIFEDHLQDAAAGLRHVERVPDVCAHEVRVERHEVRGLRLPREDVPAGKLRGAQVDAGGMARSRAVRRKFPDRTGPRIETL